MWLGGGNFGNLFDLLGPGLYLVGYVFFREISRTNSYTEVSLPLDGNMHISVIKKLPSTCFMLLLYDQVCLGPIRVIPKCRALC